MPGIFGAVWRLMVAVYRVIGMTLGFSDGFIDDGTGAMKAPSAVKATQSAVDAVTSLVGEGLDLSMMNDELI